MTPLIGDHPRTNRCRRRSTGNPRARANPPVLPTLAPQAPPPNAPPARHSRYSPTKQSHQPLQSKLIKPAATAKSP
jgi:hypothetical protein